MLAILSFKNEVTDIALAQTLFSYKWLLKMYCWKSSFKIKKKNGPFRNEISKTLN